MYCGMPIPRKVKICPECGANQDLSAQKDPQPYVMPQLSREQINPQRQVRKMLSKQQTDRRALVVVAVFFIAFLTMLFTAFFVTKMTENARSRHREDQIDEQRREKERTHPQISLPDFSMPDFSFPEIRLPEPPPADFAFAGYAVETNLRGETVLYVDVDYTNLADTQECFLTGFHITVEQEGESCRQTAGDPARENHLLGYVQPDETALVSEAFVIDAEKETTVSVVAFLGGEIYLEETVIPHADGTVSVCE
jgi:uncharacterized Zn finger protein (UPF0148 family)